MKREDKFLNALVIIGFIALVFMTVLGITNP
jgi:hypothetical protein